MSELLPERTHPGTTVEPVDPARELARRNNIFGLSLLALYFLIAGGVVIVAFVYDALANY